jgi:antibiotic biosynthesis monooxygenase (ABM) superfamily enzyme
MNTLDATAVTGTSHLHHQRGRARIVTREPVSVLFSRRVKKDREADYESWARGVTAVAHNFPGHLSASVLNVPGSRDYNVLYTFADRPSLDAWLDSDERASWMAE